MTALQGTGWQQQEGAGGRTMRGPWKAAVGEWRTLYRQSGKAGPRNSLPVGPMCRLLEKCGWPDVECVVSRVMQAQGWTAGICHASEKGMVSVGNLDLPGHSTLDMLTSFGKFPWPWCLFTV